MIEIDLRKTIIFHVLVFGVDIAVILVAVVEEEEEEVVFKMPVLSFHSLSSLILKSLKDNKATLYHSSPY